MNAMPSAQNESSPPKAAGKASLAVIVSFALSVAWNGASAQERDGKDVVDAVCSKCHAEGMNGAPKIGDKKAWSKRASRGLSGLTGNVLKGIRKMPPHGADMNLTDTEIKRAVTYMVNQSGGNWVEPVSKKSPLAERTGAQVVKAQCSNCHQTGKGGAPKIGDREDRKSVV